ncbi:hypothetical protein BDZ91DRAFT_794272 [Kalaharituber pfeilii]|nr:hypothetical protein BDZ91DRAFT_794272 [Kalaharituber pfeilii]
MASISPYNPLSRTSSSYYPQTYSIHPSKLREAQEKKMAYTQAYQLAQRARGKLQKEASQHDHNLRLLVGHANLLDSLMIALAEAEREQEHWFNEVVQGSIAAEEEEEEYEEESRDWPDQTIDGQGWLAADYYSDSDSADSDSDSESEVDSDEEMEDVDYSIPTMTRKSSHKSIPSYFETVIGVSEVDECGEDLEDQDEDGMYPLRRTPSHGSPPLLVEDLSDDDEEESTPPSPPQLSLPFTSIKGKERILTTAFYDKHPDSSPISSHHAAFLDGNEFIHRPASMISTF